MFALLIFLAAGIHPIITSSSDKKLEIAQALGAPGAVEILNYRAHPNWEEQVRRIASGRGVDIVVDNVGPTDQIDSFFPGSERSCIVCWVSRRVQGGMSNLIYLNLCYKRAHYYLPNS